MELDVSTHATAADLIAAALTRHLWVGFHPEGPAQPHAWGLHQVIARDGDRLDGVVVFDSHRGQGELARFCAANPTVKLAVPEECRLLRAWCGRNNVARETLPLFPGPEYAAILAHYGDRRAERSGVRLMDHIDAGLWLLTRIGGSPAAKRAFCLHPLVQSDQDLAASWARGLHRRVDPEALALALEYRNIANQHLSPRRVDSPAEISLSPIPAVNDMLKADKIQNRRDFERFHAQSHPQRERLSAYFGEWLERLGIDEATYQGLVADLGARTTVEVR